MANQKIVKAQLGHRSVVISISAQTKGVLGVASIDAQTARQLAIELAAYADQLEKRMMVIEGGQTDAMNEIV